MMVSTEILLAMMVWISSITALPVGPIPHMQYSDGKTMKLMLYGCDQKEQKDSEVCKTIQNMDVKSRDNNTLGLYDHHRHIVYLNPSIKKLHPIVRNSVIVHELVHAMQFPAKVPYKCFGELEELAYEVQNKYLKKHGRKDMYEELDLSPLYLMVLFSCDQGALYFWPDLGAKWIK